LREMKEMRSSREPASRPALRVRVRVTPPA
jgi:hypothetical protein